MYIGITVGLIGFLAIVIVIATITSEDVFKIWIPVFFIRIASIAIAFLIHADGAPTNIKTINVVAEKSVVTATAKWEG